MSVKKMSAVLAGLVISIPALAVADDEPDALQILKKVDKATKAVKAVTYDVEYYGKGSLAERVPRITGKVQALRRKRGLLGRLFGAAGDRLRFEGTIRMPGEKESKSCVVATDGKRAYSIDKSEKTFTAGKMPEATILLLGGSGSWFMREFLHKTPFSDEINGDSQKHEGTRTVGDVDCDVIYVVYSEGTGEARWYFGRKDHLPRRVDRKRGKDGYTVQIVKNLDVSPDLSPSDFRLKRPKGYAVKEFEPPPPPPPPELLAVGSPAPDWELKDAGGRTVSLKSLRGNVVVMDFWATWCGPCKMAMPGIEKVHQAFKDQRVRIYGVNCWEKGRGDPVAYMKKKKYTYGLLLEGDKVAEAYKVRGIPTFYVIDPEGKIAYAASGFAPGHEKKLSQTIKKIVMAPNL